MKKNKQEQYNNSNVECENYNNENISNFNKNFNNNSLIQLVELNKNYTSVNAGDKNFSNYIMQLNTLKHTCGNAFISSKISKNNPKKEEKQKFATSTNALPYIAKDNSLKQEYLNSESRLRGFFLEKFKASYIAKQKHEEELRQKHEEELRQKHEEELRQKHEEELIKQKDKNQQIKTEFLKENEARHKYILKVNKYFKDADYILHTSKIKKINLFFESPENYNFLESIEKETSEAENYDSCKSTYEEIVGSENYDSYSS